MDRRLFLGFMASGTLSIMANNRFERVNKRDDSLWITDMQAHVFLSVAKKVELVKRTVGQGNFNIISFDTMLKIASRYSRIGKFIPQEVSFMEEIFYQNPDIHGFYGRRTVSSITTKINRRDVSKIPHTGHYLFHGHSKKSYKRVIGDVGKSLILTSGVRGVPKQMNLYFNKIKRTGGNISLASRSLAPPAYSYHSVGDFDVGKIGWGYKNFTVSFITTKEFWRLRQLSYISMRYTVNNKEGVRFEPWHVKII